MYYEKIKIKKEFVLTKESGSVGWKLQLRKEAMKRTVERMAITSSRRVSTYTYSTHSRAKNKWSAQDQSLQQ